MSDETQGCLARLLIVDDEASIRTSLSCVLSEIGYVVRSAEDGHSALQEIGKEVPEILLSDLYMPGMSGFELLFEVRRRYPAIQTVAMSGAFQGDEVPSGVAADGFFQKGSSIGSLLRIMSGLPCRDRGCSTQPDRDRAQPARSAGNELSTNSISQPTLLRKSQPYANHFRIEHTDAHAD